MDHVAYLDTLSKGPIPKELPFPEEEYRRRIDRVREGMDEAGLDVLLVTHIPNLNYLTGYYTVSVDNHACLILAMEGEPSMHIASLEITATLLCSWIKEVVTFDWHQTGGIASQLAGILKAKGLGNKRIGMETQLLGLRPATYRQIEAALPDATVQDASDVVFNVRVIKSSKELEFIREAGRMTWAGMSAALPAIRGGINDSDVARIVYDAVMGAGSEFSSSQMVVTSGHRVGWIHTNHRRVPIREGDTVFLEFSGTYQRYTAPMMRTAVIGPPSEEVKRVTEAVKDTFSNLVAAAGPGRTCHEVAVEGKKGFAYIDSEVFFTGVFGYNVGIGFPPTWVEGMTYIAEGIDRPLEPGMVFHLPICLRVPGKLGVGLSETIAITETGCEILTRKERDIYVSPVS